VVILILIVILTLKILFIFIIINGAIVVDVWDDVFIIINLSK